MADRTPQTGVKKVIGDVRSLQDRAKELERPAGTQYAKLVETVQAKLDQIDQEVADAINANSYTKSVIDQKFSDTASDYNGKLDGKANSSHTHNQADISGTWTKDVSSGTVQTNLLYATGAPGYNITGTRVAGWWESATGRAGTASSSERFKSNVENWSGDPRKILQMTPVLYQYTEQMDLAENLCQGKVPYRYEPGFQAHQELGLIAERLAELGFWEVVVWERDENDQLVLDADGKPIPFGIHYHLIAVLQQKALQWLDERLQTIEARLDITVG